MVDRSAVGKPLAPTTIAIERGPVSNFAKAVKDDNPVYARPDAAREAGFENIPAPPTWGFAMANWGQFPELQPPGAEGGQNAIMEVIGNLMRSGGLILHGEQEFVYHAPIVVGDVLTSEGRISDLQEKTSSSGAKMTFISSETDYTNQRGEKVLTAVMTLVHRA